MVIYAFAAPIGAVLTLYLLTRPTHTVPEAARRFHRDGMALGGGLVAFP